MENDSITTQVTETIQDTSALTTMTESIQKLTTTPVSEWLPDLVKTYLVPLGLKILAAIVVLLLGRWVIKLVKKWMANGLMSRHGDATLHSFLSNLVSVLLYFILIIAIIGILGINTSSLVALLASAGLAVGMSLGGTLQNFAGGVLIIMFRPFKVGDFIASQGYEGIVSTNPPRRLGVFHLLWRRLRQSQDRLARAVERRPAHPKVTRAFHRTGQAQQQLSRHHRACLGQFG